MQSDDSTLHRLTRRTKTLPNGCWLWCGGSTVWTGVKDEKPHRVAYALYIGEIPRGMQVVRTCETVGCINPHHARLDNRNGKKTGDGPSRR